MSADAMNATLMVVTAH